MHSQLTKNTSQQENILTPLLLIKNQKLLAGLDGLDGLGRQEYQNRKYLLEIINN